MDKDRKPYQDLWFSKPEIIDIDGTEAERLIKLQLGDLIADKAVLEALNTNPQTDLRGKGIRTGINSASKYSQPQEVDFAYTPAQVRKILLAQLKLPVDPVLHRHMTVVDDSRRIVEARIPPRVQIYNIMKQKGRQGQCQPGQPITFEAEDEQVYKDNPGFVTVEYGSVTETTRKIEIPKNAAIINVCDVASLTTLPKQYFHALTELLHGWSYEFIASQYGRERVSESFFGLSGKRVIEIGDKKYFYGFAGPETSVLASKGLAEATAEAESQRQKGLDVYTLVTLGPDIDPESTMRVKQVLAQLASQSTWVGLFEVIGRSEFLKNISSGSQMPSNVRTALIPNLKGIYPALLNTFP